MRFMEKAVTLKDGRSFTLRSPQEADAEGMLAYLRKIAGETNHLLRTLEEGKACLLGDWTARAP